MDSENKNQIPKWMKVITFLMSGLAIFVGFSLYISPGKFIPEVDFSSPNIKFLADMWGARQIALGLVILYSGFKNNPVMLKTSLLVYFIMNIQDVGIGIFKSDPGLYIGAGFFTLLSGFLIYTLSRLENS
jgi:hypothetical protein